MSDWIALAAGLATIKKRESRIAPYKRDVERMEEEQQEAIKKLEEATDTLIKLVAKRNSHDS